MVLYSMAPQTLYTQVSRHRIAPATGRDLARSETGCPRRYTREVVDPQEAPVPKDYVRLTQPLVRDSKDAPLRPASWDEALTRVVAGFQAARAAHGPTTFGTFSCSKATNEVNFAAQKFSRTVLGSNNIDSCNRT
jgi:anaerobic selenocysteine-containing dehydrogenase